MNDRFLHGVRSVGSIAFEVLSGGDYKAKLPQNESEYVTTWHTDIEGARKRIRSLGYTYQQYAARKFLEGYGRDDGSYAKIDHTEPAKQYHVHLYEVRDNQVALFSHWEYRPIYPLKHYRVEEYVAGKTCGELK